jgi:PBP1b-binding outer membrane lipoprotein LpoB
MFKNRIVVLVNILLLVTIFFSCKSTEVEVVSKLKEAYVEKFWNETDSELASDSLINQILKIESIAKYFSKNKPKLAVGSILNLSNEEIDTSLISKNIERSLLNSGKITFVSSKMKREEQRSERKNSIEFANNKEFSKYIKNLKADFFIDGKIELKIDSLKNPIGKEYNLILKIFETKNPKSPIEKSIMVVKQ